MDSRDKSSIKGNQDKKEAEKVGGFNFACEK